MKISHYIPIPVKLLLIAITFSTTSASAYSFINNIPDNFFDVNLQQEEDTNIICRGRYKYKSYTPFNSLEIDYRGKITVTNDDKDIKSISPGGYLTISNKTFGNRRTVRIKGVENGKLKREYFVGKNQESWEPDGRKWLAENLLDVIRISGIDAENRVRRIYKNNGIEGVLDEISEISSNSISTKYFEATLEIEELKQ